MQLQSPLIRDINSLAKRYKTMNYYPELASLLKSAFPNESFSGYSKYELHKVLNKRLIENYRGEEILKHALFEMHERKQNVIGAFEIKVNNSRLDFLSINGHTTSFEIKSELDNLSKLKKQILDYMLVFEFNYVLIDHKHEKNAIALLPQNAGILIYKDSRSIILRKATLNNHILPKCQLDLLTKKELIMNFPDCDGVTTNILQAHSALEINSLFKKILKTRYRHRWDFLCKNSNAIFPIDVQFFFNTNIHPSIIYSN
ncbi:MAG: sce7726 family protein [Chitinophagaceae bacterium]|nr:sce7726 family protein [Chitinophagaceae bacterium]